MTRRYNWHDEAVPHTHLFVVPGDTPSVSSVEPRGRTWGVRVRGDSGGTVTHSYRCPVHGLFDAVVPRAAVPDVVACPSVSWSVHGLFDVVVLRESENCGESSPWAGSRCGIGWAAGEVTS